MITVFRDPALRVLAAMIVLYGAIMASFSPYVSVMAVQVFALGDGGFAGLIWTASVVAVTAAVWLGVRADQRGGRRATTLASAASLAAGLGAVAAVPSAGSFVLAHALLIPVGSALFGQIFAYARLAAAGYSVAQRTSITGALRALLAAPFPVVLPAWAAAFERGAGLTAIYPVAAAMAVLLLGLAAVWLPRDGRIGAGGDAPAGLRFGAALAEMGRPAVASRVVAMGAIWAAGATYMALIALVLSPAAGRGPADVALYVGIVAGLEVPFMLLWARLAQGMRLAGPIALGAAVYWLHLALLPVLAPSPWLWALVLPAAAGGAAMIALPIVYLADLLDGRPGAGAALISLSRIACDGLAAVAFALGTALAGYGLVAALGVAVAACGAAALLLLDARAGPGAQRS